MIAALPTIRRLTNGRSVTERPFNPEIRDALLEALFASASDLLLAPVQDVFGWRDRINEPALVSDANWIFRLPWLSDRLDDEPEARERQAALLRWSQQHGRA
jgi:4-alpha-glucanotransferase